MQLVILAAGKGTRMRERTLSTPKPLLIKDNKTLLEHKLDALPSQITEVIIVVGYLGDMIRETITDQYNSIPITYITQHEQKGTAHALWLCKDILNGQFAVLMGDDIYDHFDLSALCDVAPDEWSALLQHSSTKTSCTKCIVENGLFTAILQDSDGVIPYNYVYTGACVLDTSLFEHEMVAISDTEYGLPHTFIRCAPSQKIKAVFATNWKQVTSPEDLE